jgi:hypothetical protein
MGIKLYNNLPTYIKTEINNAKILNFYLRIYFILLMNAITWIKDLFYLSYCLLLFLWLIDIVLNLFNYCGRTS